VQAAAGADRELIRLAPPGHQLQTGRIVLIMEEPSLHGPKFVWIYRSLSWSPNPKNEHIPTFEEEQGAIDPAPARLEQGLPHVQLAIVVLVRGATG